MKQIENVLICIMGLSMAWGEQLNVINPLVSKIFVIAGVLLFLILVIESLGAGKKRVLNPMNTWFWLTLSTILLVLFLRFDEISSIKESSEIIDKFKIPIFLIILWSLCSCFQSNSKLITLFLLSFLLSFIATAPFGVDVEYEFATRFAGTYANPNTYAVECVFAVYASLYLLSHGRFKYFYYIAILIAVYYLLRTGSRGAFSSLSIGVALLTMLHSTAKQKVAIFSVVGIMLLIVSSSSILASYGVLDRLFEKSYSGNIRLTIWASYLSNIDMFFWIGMKEENFQLINHFTPHNSFLGLWVRYGIFLLISYITFYILLFIKSIIIFFKKKSKYTDRVIIAMFFSLTQSGMTMENTPQRDTWVILALVFTIITSYAQCKKISSNGISTNYKKINKSVE